MKVKPGWRSSGWPERPWEKAAFVYLHYNDPWWNSFEEPDMEQLAYESLQDVLETDEDFDTAPIRGVVVMHFGEWTPSSEVPVYVPPEEQPRPQHIFPSGLVPDMYCPPCGGVHKYRTNR